LENNEIDDMDLDDIGFILSCANPYEAIVDALNPYFIKNDTRPLYVIIDEILNNNERGSVNTKSNLD
jgi:hypothetical protein